MPLQELSVCAAHSMRIASSQRRRWLGVSMVGAVGLLIRPGFVAAAVDSITVAEPKQAKASRYLNAADVPGFMHAQGGAGKVLFPDLSTRAEAMYVGMAQGIDTLVPFVEHQELMPDWDAQRGIYRLKPLQKFVPEVHRQLVHKGLSKTDTVMLICRSGDRSSRGANRLADDGYTQVWSVVDGFEGDIGKDGRRSVNDWKNAGLPWSYKLGRDRTYSPR